MDGLVAPFHGTFLNNLADRINRLTAAEQRQFEARMQQKQMKEFMGVSLHIYSSHLE
jgi:hypothetical protein